MLLTGDTHGTFDIAKLHTTHTKNIIKEMDKDDAVMVAGDFGFVWGATFSPTELHWLKWMGERNCPFVFIPGNHENYERLNSDEFPIIPMFGDFVKQIYKNVYMLQTGHIYAINGKSVFAFGGGMSIDKLDRIPYISWWPEEIPTYAQIHLGLDNLAKVGNKVDLVFTHATHETFYNKMFLGRDYKEKDPLHSMLEEFRKIIDYKVWVCGHYHEHHIDTQTKSVCLYNEVKTYEELYNVIHR